MLLRLLEEHLSYRQSHPSFSGLCFVLPRQNQYPSRKQFCFLRQIFFTIFPCLTWHLSLALFLELNMLQIADRQTEDLIQLDHKYTSQIDR